MIFYSRGSLVEIGIFDGEDVDGAFITGDAQERGVVAEADAAITNVEIIRTLNKQTYKLSKLRKNSHTIQSICSSLIQCLILTQNYSYIKNSFHDNNWWCLLFQERDGKDQRTRMHFSRMRTARALTGLIS